MVTQRCEDEQGGGELGGEMAAVEPSEAARKQGEDEGWPWRVGPISGSYSELSSAAEFVKRLD